MSKLKIGDRVRLKVRLLNGYKGEATVLRIDHKDGLEDLVDIWLDGDPLPRPAGAGSHVCATKSRRSGSE